MNSHFALSWLSCATALLLIALITLASNQMEIPLIYINNIFMDNFIIENHTIQFVNVQDPEECFRHCAKHFDYVAFKSLGNMWGSGHRWSHWKSNEKNWNSFISHKEKWCESKVVFLLSSFWLRMMKTEKPHGSVRLSLQGTDENSKIF